MPNGPRIKLDTPMDTTQKALAECNLGAEVIDDTTIILERPLPPEVIADTIHDGFTFINTGKPNVHYGPRPFLRRLTGFRKKITRKFSRK